MTTPDRPLEISITRRFDVPPEAVFAQWLDPDALKDWFAPETYAGLAARTDPREGGEWFVEFLSASGERFSEGGVYKEISPFRRLVMTLVQSVPGAPELTITVVFEPDANGVLMHFHQTGFVRAEHRDGVAEGWAGCLDKLSLRLRRQADSEAEIRALFAQWFDAARRKDLDASMAPISSKVVSYEHSMPLQVTDIEQIRAECKQGFDRSTPQFQWDIPDLKIIVRGDIAVTWGLNRMADVADDVRTEMWSRGTRVFQRLDGRWRLIHQHLSFPMDPATAQARLDLAP